MRLEQCVNATERVKHNYYSIYMIYQVTVAYFFVVIAIYIDIFKQFLD